MKAKQIIVLFFVTLGILVENVNTSPISDDNFNSMVIKINVFLHELWTPNEAFFHRNPKTIGLAQTIWADKFWGIWGIFGRFISTHFVAVSSLSMLSVSQ